MRFLVLGGTAWLGRTIAAAALAAGHEVTCVARGSDVPSGARLVQADRDDDDALAPVTASRWDAVMDVGRQPLHVRRAVRDLEPVSDRYVFVSTANVYASQAEVGADESAALLEPLDGDRIVEPDDYGPAKVACEAAILDGFGPERTVIARSGLIGGPGDPSGRTGYWPLRFARPSGPEGLVLVPEVPELTAALIDVRDLATWLVRLAERSATGIFNAFGDAIPLAEHLATARAVGGRGTPVGAAPDWLLAHEVAEWSGPRSLPLWLADRDWYGMNARSNARAKAAGLALRPLAETLADALAHDLSRDGEVARGAGLTDAEERELLEALRA